MLSFSEYTDDNTASTMKARDFKGFTDLVVGTLDTQCGYENQTFQSVMAGHVIPVSFNHQAGGNTDSKLGMRHNLANTLTCNQTQAVCIAGNIIDRQPQHGGNHIGTSEEISYTLTTADRHAVRIQYKVRRLLPIECERLQGFPDNYTNIPNSSDSVRYKALGNSMAVPVMKWLGERILNE